MKKRLLSRVSLLSLIAAISLAVLAQQPASQLTPSADRLRQHVMYLASDALNGRRTGTQGANDAAHYIAGEFARLGLRAGGQQKRAARTGSQRMATFLQPFPFVAGVDLGRNNSLSFFMPPPAGTPMRAIGSVAGAALKVGEDWMPLGMASNSRIEGAQVVFVGFGITAAELNYDSYAGADIAGKIAIALSGTPDGDNPHGQFARYEDVRWKAIAARNAGAKALIVIAREEVFKDDRLSRLRYDNSAGDAGLPVAVISKQAFPRIFRNAAPLTELEAGAKADNHKPIKLQDAVLTLQVDLVRREVTATNVIGILDGSDRSLKNEVLIIGAHYDHLGRGGEGSLAAREGEIHHGADDNASGVAGVLELARILTSQRPKPKRTIIFMAFSGEEEGLLGSNYYVNHPVVPISNTIAMINMDMIGRMKANKLIIGGVGTASEWKASIEEAEKLVSTAHGLVAGTNPSLLAEALTKPFELTLNEDGFGPSDHSSFYAKQVPVLFFWTGTHEDYHKPSDTADKINYLDEARILTLVENVIAGIDASSKRPTYTVAKSESAGRATGFRVYLGTIPNYAETNDGLLLDGVREDSPAAKAGLKAGDRIVKLAGRDVHNVYDYTYALGEMKAGQEYEVEIMRGGERLTLKLTPAARK